MKPLFVVFGATGDLTRRKVIPALYHVMAAGDRECVLLGVGGADLGDDGFNQLARSALAEHGFTGAEADAWCHECVAYHQAERSEGYSELAATIDSLEKRHGLSGDRVYYLAIPPSAFQTAVSKLGAAGLHEPPGWVRLVVEKPFGRGLESAQQLNEAVHRWFSEDSVYRIDHYLGKDTVQNLLVFRFANSIFESSWNRDRVQRVEITVAEQLTVAGRGGYYEQTGVLRDMVQNHVTQLLSLVAMEPPADYSPTAIRNEKVKVLRSVEPIGPDDVVLGQYDGYRADPDTAADSDTPTFAALRVGLDNWRWQGVPFYLRTGKAMSQTTTQVAVVFNAAPISFFRRAGGAKPDVLLITLQPDEGFALQIDVKRPRERMTLEPISLDFDYASRFGSIPEAYETLLADVIEGDQTLFVRSDEVEESWRLFDPVIAAPGTVHPYASESWGPAAADALLGEGAGWVTR